MPWAPGTTAAVHQLQQILGIYVPPAGKDFFQKLLKAALSPAGVRGPLPRDSREARPVVFVGPYEHHSNEVSWRECFAEVVEIELTPGACSTWMTCGPRLAGRVRGQAEDRRVLRRFQRLGRARRPCDEVARILHEHDALAFFDFAAIAPYEPIDMRREERASSLDAIYFSPHKFLGGPGSCGVLIFHQRIYRADLPPTVGAGARWIS